ncbi:MAG: hypothetical protein ACJ77D_14665 [Chloroflexota bacterium]|jgi:hypothetical protein
MADKSVADKLLIKPGSTLWVSDATRGDLLGPLPDGVAPTSDPAKASTSIVIADDADSVRRRFATDGRALLGSGNLWVLYRKGNKADINRDSLWPILADFGFRPISQVSVDETWSALRFRALKPGEPPFSGGR